MKYRCCYCGAPIKITDLNCEYCNAGNEFYKPSPMFKLLMKGMSSLGAGLVGAKLIDKLLPDRKVKKK